MVPAQRALLRLMMLASAADGALAERELGAIGDLVRTLPAFAGLSYDDLLAVSDETRADLDHEDGVDVIIADSGAALSAPLRETGYALAVEVAVADHDLTQEELRLLDMIATAFAIAPLTRRSIEESARIRLRRIPAGA